MPRPANWTRIDNLDLNKLARLLNAENASAGNWSGDDAAVILRHQLGAPLLPDLLLVPGAEEARLRSLVQGRPGTGSFLEQLTFLYPSLELLQAIKAFARHVHGDVANPLHAAPADVLYYAAIAAALLRCEQRITKLGDAELKNGFSWAMQQPGAEPLQPMLQAASTKLSG